MIQSIDENSNDFIHTDFMRIYAGVLGTFISIMTPFIKNLPIALQICGSAGGLILIGLSIWAKWLEIQGRKRGLNKRNNYKP